MNKRYLIFPIAICLLAAFILLPALPALASAAQPQASFATPTANADGRILYKVQPGDTCIGVSLRMGISQEQIQLLNDIRGDCQLIAGADLLLGTVVPEPTASGPTPIPSPLVPSPTPLAGNGEVCVQLFNDLNGNARIESGETNLAGGAVSLTDAIGKVSKTGTTDGTAPLCFSEIPEGQYSISMAVPEGYNATTRTNYALGVKAGDQVVVDFGSQISQAAQPVPVSEGGRSPLMAIAGVLILLGGAALAVYARVILKR